MPLTNLYFKDKYQSRSRTNLPIFLSSLNYFLTRMAATAVAFALCSKDSSQSDKIICLIKGTLIFGVFFGLVFWYFFEEYDTGIFTTLGWSFGVGISMSLGYCLSKYVRCALWLFFPQLLSGSGLSMLLCLVSWKVLSIPLHGILDNLHKLNLLLSELYGLPVQNEFYSQIESFASASRIIHHVMPLPLLVVFLTSLIYIFFERSKSQFNLPEETNLRHKAISYLTNCFTCIQSGLSGGAVSFVTAALFFEYVTYTILHYCAIWSHVETTVSDSFESHDGLIAFYSCFVLFVMLISPFGNHFQSLSERIVRMYWPVSAIPIPTTIRLEMHERIRQPSESHIEFHPTMFDSRNRNNRERHLDSPKPQLASFSEFEP